MIPSRYHLISREGAKLTTAASRNESVTEDAAGLVAKAREYLRTVESDSYAIEVGAAQVRLSLRTMLRRLGTYTEQVGPEALKEIQLLVEELPDHIARGKMRFHNDVFSPYIPQWKKNLGHLFGRPGLQFLEVGSAEGQSAVWMLEKALTHPTSALTCIDTFDYGGQSVSLSFVSPASSSLEARFDNNINGSGASARVTKLVGISQKHLRALPWDFYDFIYIDGSHDPKDVLEDIVLAWRLLKVGAIITFDDYGIAATSKLQPRIAIDAFLAIFEGAYRVIHKGFQVTLERLA